MNTKRLVLDAVLSALSVILYLFVKFPLPMLFPGFLEMNFSMLPILIALLLFGVKDASIVAIFRILCKIILIPTGTHYVGEIADFLMSFIVIFGVFFVNRYTKNKLVLSFSIIFFWVLAGIITNLVVNIPLYIKLEGLTYALLAQECSVIPGVNAENFLVKYTFFAVIPFNLLLSSIVTLVTIIVYDRLRKIESFNF